MQPVPVFVGEIGSLPRPPASWYEAGRIFCGETDPRSWILNEQRTPDLPPPPTMGPGEALRHKEDGNVHFRAGRYEDALSCYNLSIRCDNTTCHVFANRTNALLNLEKPAEALLDADRAIELNVKWQRPPT